MKKNLMFFTIGVLFSAVIMFGFEGFAESFTKTIEVTFNSINLRVNGNPVQAENILYNNTTYVPIRVVAKMFDKDIAWNEDTNTASINDQKSSAEVEGERQETEIQTFMEYGKKYVGFRDIEAKHGCFFSVANTNDLSLYNNSTEYAKGNKAVIELVPNVPIKGKNNVVTLGIEYDYYINIIVPELEKRGDSGVAENTGTEDYKSGLNIVEMNGVEYVSILDIAEKHTPKGQFSYYNNKMSLFSSKDKPVLLIDNVPFKSVDNKHYIEYSYYKERIYPLLK